MGGCCCCLSNGAEVVNTPAYYYCPQVSEEHIPLSPNHVASSAFPTGLLVNTNLETSSPDTYRPPPAPIPFDVALGHPRTPPRTIDSCIDKNVTAWGVINSDSDQVIVGCNTKEASEKYEELKESDCKAQTSLDRESAKELEVELSKSVDPIAPATEDEDACPICLDEYDAENPKLITKCDHHFHLACILEWMERSETCPVCDQEMIFNPPID